MESEDTETVAYPSGLSVTRDENGHMVYRIGIPGAAIDWSTGSIVTDSLESGLEDETASAKRKEANLRSSVSELLVTADLDVEWSDVVGNEDARQALIEAIEYPVQHADVYAFYNKKPGKGVLLSGPPGNGKTMLGRAAASVIAKLHGKKPGEATMLLVNGPSIQSMWVGRTEEKIRDIFAYAKAYKDLHKHLLVIFIDECDSLLPCRDGRGREPKAWEETNVATFLAEMDGIEASGAFVILATNRPEAIDPALLRPGRCDRRISVKRPNRDDASNILHRNLRGVPVSAPDTIGVLVETAIDELYRPDHKLLRIVHENGSDFLFLSDVMSGAMCVGLVERAKNIAFRRDVSSGSAPTGLMKSDFIQAVRNIADEMVGVPDHYAIREFCDRTGIRELSLEHVASKRVISTPRSKALN